MKLQERYRRVDHDTLELSMTLTDPKTYTEPWVSKTKKFELLKKRRSPTTDGTACWKKSAPPSTKSIILWNEL